MKRDERFDLIQLRLKQAQETIEEAEILLAAGAFRGSVNRAYYAMFYSVQALALLKQMPISKHTGNVSFFDKEFVKPGIFAPELSKAFHRAFDLRQKSDYKEYEIPDQATAVELVTSSQKFLRAIHDYLAAQENDRN